MVRPTGQTHGRLPLKSQHMDPQFWAKLTALWHRERMREVYISTGVDSAEARHRANREALEIAHKHGWVGQLPQLKTALSELIVNELPGRGKVIPGYGIRFWEERTHRDMMRILAYPAERLELELAGYLKEEVLVGGRFAGRPPSGESKSTNHFDPGVGLWRALHGSFGGLCPARRQWS